MLLRRSLDNPVLEFFVSLSNSSSPALREAAGYARIKLEEVKAESQAYTIIIVLIFGSIMFIPAIFFLHTLASEEGYYSRGGRWCRGVRRRSFERVKGWIPGKQQEQQGIEKGVSSEGWFKKLRGWFTSKKQQDVYEGEVESDVLPDYEMSCRTAVDGRFV